MAIGLAIAASSAVVEQSDNLLTHGASLYEQIADVVSNVESEKAGDKKLGEVELDGSKEKDETSPT